jgi:hypothetical protein
MASRTTVIELLEGSPAIDVQAAAQLHIDAVRAEFDLADLDVRMTKVGPKLYVEIDGHVAPDVTVTQEHDVRTSLRDRLETLPYEIWLNLELTPHTETPAGQAPTPTPTPTTDPKDHPMNPTELHLFSSAEQTLLVHTERARLAELSEDELDELFTRVRRARTKYTKLYRRQSADLVKAKSSRSGTSTSNQRTKRKAEILEDALARVATALGAAARTTAKELKAERLAAAKAAKGSPAKQGAASAKKTSATDKRGNAATGRSTSKSRQASRTASGARNQARRDNR